MERCICSISDDTLWKGMSWSQQLPQAMCDAHGSTLCPPVQGSRQRAASGCLPECPSATPKCSFSHPNASPKSCALQWSCAESTLMKHCNDCCDLYTGSFVYHLYAAFLLAGVIYCLCRADLSLIIIFYGPKIKGISSPIL